MYLFYSNRRPEDAAFLDLLRELTSVRPGIRFIAGPPGMVTALRQMLAAAGADEDDIRTEEFGGY
jgi:ferredoxin-NADP reductase